MNATNPHVEIADRQIAAATAILALADKEERDLTDAERTAHDGHMARATSATKAAAEFRSLATTLGEFRPAGAPAAGAVEFRGVKAEAGGGAPKVERRAAVPKVETAILVPTLAEYRAAQAEGSDPAGGFMVPVEQAPAVVERLAPASVLLTAEPRLFPMNSDEMRVPMVATGAVVGMVAENQPIPEGNIVFSAAALIARKLAGLVRASNEWLSDAIPDARTVVEQNLLREIAIELDRQFFDGDGVAPNLLGILRWPGVTSTPGAATLDDIAAAIGRVEAAYAVPDAIFISPANWSALRVERDGGATGAYVLAPDASSAARPSVFGVPVYVTPHVGTSIVVADMSAIAVGVRDRWSVHYDPYRYSEFDQSAIRVTSRWAIAPLHVDAVEIITTGVAAADADRATARDSKPAKK